MSRDSSPDPALSNSTNTNNNKRDGDGDSSDRGCDKRQKLCGLQTTTPLAKCLTLSKVPKHEITAEEKSRLLNLSQRYLQYFKNSSDTEEKTSINLCPAASAWWLLESDWQDQAYQELLLIRNMHSLLLEQVYKDECGACYKSTKSAREHKKHVKKLLNFLGKSRDEISAIAKEECHDLMIDIKCVVAYHAKSNWRDEAYERLVSLRKLYSCKLDKAYKYVHGGNSESDVLIQYKKECLVFLGDSLNFLGNTRADILLHSEETCYRHLEAIESFANDGNDSVMWRRYNGLRRAANFINCDDEEEMSSPNWLDMAYEEEESSSPNWRDMAYEEIKSMREAASLGDYAYARFVWSEYPHLQELSDELGRYIEFAANFFNMTRSRLALLSKDKYAMHVKEVTQLLKKIEKTMMALQMVEPVRI